MTNPDLRVNSIIGTLANRIGKLALVYEGWPSDKHAKDLRKTCVPSEGLAVPEVSIAKFDHWPNHLDVNVWARSRHERDEVSSMVMGILNEIKAELNIGIREIRAQDITFEEKGSIRPGKWDIIVGSKPVFRKLIQVSLS
jgi:hypothetical protein